MILFKQFILNEGGNIFKGKTDKIKKEHIEPTMVKYFEELKKVFPKKSNIFNKSYFHYLGSVGKKPYSGDIDLGIDSSVIAGNNFDDKSLKEWNLDPAKVKAEFEKLKKRAKTSTDNELMMKATLKGIVEQVNSKAKYLYQDEKKITPANIFGFFPQYDEDDNKLDMGVQIDWMISEIELLKFSYYSEVYEGDNVKGLHRTQLLVALFQVLGISFSHTKGITDKSTGKLITKKPKEIVEYLEDKLGLKLSKDVIKNYFKLSDIIFHKIDPNIKDDTIDEYFKILDRTRTDIPYNLQDEWKKRKKKLGLTGKFLPDNSKLKNI